MTPSPPPASAPSPAPASPPTTLSVIVPASNEAGYIGAALDALLASDPPEGQDDCTGWEVIVVANGCTDATAAIARAKTGAATARGWRLEVAERAHGDKMGALNHGDGTARGAVRVYLDADVIVSPPLLGQIASALARPDPAWASGRPKIAPARSAVTRAYSRFWSRLPFMTRGVPGFGIFAVNAAGRARWGAFPDIISDDTFVRLNFASNERIGVPASYAWPMVEGFSRLVRVRRRQDAGVAEVAKRFPALMANDDKPRTGAGHVARLALADPAGFAVYAAVALAVRLGGRRGAGWARGR